MTALIGAYLRATVVQGSKQAEVVLVTDQPVAALLPALLDVLEHHGPVTPIGGSGVHLLHTQDGHALDLEKSLQEAKLRDGVTLHLVASVEAPPEPTVVDLIDVVEGARTRGGHWGPCAAEWTRSGLACLLLLLGVAATASSARIDPTWWYGWSALATVATSALGAARRHLCWAWMSGGAALMLAGAWILAADYPAHTCTVLVAAVGAMALAAWGWSSRQWRQAASGVAVLTLLSAVGIGTWAWCRDGVLVSATVLVASVCLVGVLPRVALGVTGVFTLDARIAHGHRVSRPDAASAVAAGHRGLLVAVTVCAASFAGAGWVIGSLSAGDPWAIALVVAATLGWGARVRHFPLTSQRLIVWLGVAAAVAGLIWGVAVLGSGSAVRVGAACLLGAVAIVLFPADVLTVIVRAQIRRWVQRIEAAAVLALMPLLVGMFGLYADLLATFG